MEPARLPKDVPSLLLRDTIELDNLRLAWPQIMFDRRRASENLVNTQVWRAFLDQGPF